MTQLVFRSCWRLGVPGLLLVGLTSFAGAAPEAKRVLVVHSFANAAPPFTIHSTAFESELTTKMGERIDLDEVSLDVARYATLDMEEALIELMRKRQAKWQPDLVVTMSSPAGVFVAQHRDRLFPRVTPIIYSGMDPRRLPPDALQQNAAFVGGALNLPALVEDILQVAPATTNITVVIGASQFEQYWTAAIQHEWLPFTNRVNFTWLNDLSFDQMLARVSTLPPRSFVFFALLIRDASGVTHNADEALKRIRTVANAPINGAFYHQLGFGILGGRLHRVERQGVEAARVAVRTLQGEPASNFPPQVLGAESPQYDWRELRRWNISADRLPPGSQVLFREPTTWEQYKWRIIAIVSLVLAEALLIFGLVANLIKRRRLEEESRRHAAELAHVTRVSTLGELSGSLAHELNQPLTAILSNAQAARRFMAGDNPDLDEVRDILKDIVEEDRRAGEIIQRMRTMLKKGQAKFEPLDLNQTIQEVLAIMRSDLVTRHVTVAVQLSPRLPLVRGDRIQIQQVLINLIVNSCDAMARQDAPARRVAIETVRDGEGHARVSVSDCGPGIPDGDAARIFEPFYSTKATGIGMGLAICRSLVASHGGRLWTEKPDGPGALFHFTIPIHQEAKA